MAPTILASSALMGLDIPCLLVVLERADAPVEGTPAGAPVEHRGPRLTYQGDGLAQGELAPGLEGGMLLIPLARAVIADNRPAIGAVAVDDAVVHSPTFSASRSPAE